MIESDAAAQGETSAARVMDIGSYLSSVWQTSNVFVNRELGDLTKQYFWMTEEEILAGLDILEGSETLFAVKVRKHSWVQQIRRLVAEKAMHDARVIEAKEGKSLEKELAEKANLALQARRREKKEKHNEGKRRRIGRLKLDDALRQAKNNVDPDRAFEGWSEARVKAFKQLDTNPNAYFYRFNADSEDQDRGAWRPEEKDLFLKRLKEMGPTQQWGIFSIAIPRRVGYQCSNFYRKLLMSGEVTDPNYVVDKNGKLRYLFANVKVDEDGKVIKSGQSSALSSKRTKSAGAGSDSNDSESNSRKSKKSRAKNIKKGLKSKKKKKKSIWESDDEDDDEDASDMEDYGRSSKPVVPSVIRTRSGAGGYHGSDDGGKEAGFTSLLPDYIDPITRAPIKKPAISKYGHVIGYDVWMKCFTSNGPDQGRCPLTNQKLSKSDITLLTPENIDLFRDKIQHLG